MFKFCNHKCEKLESDLLQKVWLEGFSAGVSKQWDTLVPLLTQNIDKLIAKIKEDAAIEAVNRLKRK